MTVISAFAIGPCPVVIGDLLLSGLEQPQQVEIPVIGNVTRVFPRGSGWSIVGLEQKVNLISDNCSAAWAGSRIGALTVMNDLRDFASQAPLTHAKITQFFLDQEPNLAESVKIVGWVKDEESFQIFSFGVEMTEAGLLGEIWAAGSGAEAFIKGIPPGRFPAADRELVPLEKAVAFFLSTIGPMLQAEFHSTETLLNFFGGGYEIATFVEDRFSKIGDITFVFWESEFRNEVVRIGLPVLALKQDYAGDTLRIRSLRFLNGHSEPYEESHHVILPLGGSAPDGFAESPPPDMNSSFTCHCVLVQSNDPMQVLVRVEYRTGGSTSIVFNDRADGVTLSVNEQFISNIAQSITKRLTAT